MIKLNSSTIVSFPTCAEWAEYYGKFREALVASLSGKFCLADREDAVEEAFHKLMHKKDVEAYGENVPKTEAEWYWNLRWQARSFLSHMQERVVRHAKYVERASKDLSGFFACGFQGYAMDLELRSRTLVRALEIYYATGRTKTETDRGQKSAEPEYDVLLLLKIEGEWKCVAKAYNQNSNTISK